MHSIKTIGHRIILALLVPVILVLHGFDNSVRNDESAVKAMFIYNFTKYFDWSPIQNKPEFIIGVYGSSPVVNYLNEIAHRKIINGKTIIIKPIFSQSEINGVQMLFVTDSAYQKMQSLKVTSISSSIIIVTESRDALKKGSHINLINIGDKLRFELNETELKHNNIKFSRELSALAYRIL